MKHTDHLNADLHEARVFVLCLALVAPALAADDALPPTFGPGEVVYIEQTGDNPLITVVDTDQDGDYDAADTSDPSVSVVVAAQCNDGDAVPPSGLVGLTAGNAAWTSGYFTFQSEPYHVMPLIQAGLPEGNTQPDFPPAHLDLAIEQCNALSGEQKATGQMIERQIGFVAHAQTCVDAPGVTTTPDGATVAWLLKNFFANAFTLGLYSIFNPIEFGAEGDVMVANTPLMVDVNCQPAEPVKVEAATVLALEEATLGGHCAINLSGTLQTNHPDQQVGFRYVDNAGHQSHAHWVTTDHSGHADFSHQYDIPVNADRPETGQVRIEGVSHEFASGWTPYALDCVAAGGSDYATRVPPVMSLDVEVEETVMMDGQVCPASVRLVAGVSAPSGFVGSLIFVGSQYFSALHPVQLAAGHRRQYGDYRDLNWGSGGEIGSALSTQPNARRPLKTQRFTMGYNLVDADGNVAWQFAPKSYSVTCTDPGVTPGLQLDSPNLTVGTLDATGGTAPGRTDDRQRVSVPAVVVLQRIDAAVTGARLSVEGRFGVVQAEIANLGTTAVAGTVVIDVSNAAGRKVATIRKPVRMVAGGTMKIRERFRAVRAQSYRASVTVGVGNDANPANNEKSTRFSQ